jgi:hypothetical protein
MNRLMIALLISLMFAACGGSPTPTPTTTGAADEHEVGGHEAEEGVESTV